LEIVRVWLFICPFLKLLGEIHWSLDSIYLLYVFTPFRIVDDLFEIFEPVKTLLSTKNPSESIISASLFDSSIFCILFNLLCEVK
jgi:hypothetical protein